MESEHSAFDENNGVKTFLQSMKTMGSGLFPFDENNEIGTFLQSIKISGVGTLLQTMKNRMESFIAVNKKINGVGSFLH